MSGDGADHGTGQLGGRDGVGAQGVHDQDALFGCEFDVDVVDASSSSGDQLQVLGARAQNFGRHFCC